jgi:hypothetical protein
MLFLQTFMKKLVSTKPSSPKRHVDAFTVPIFAGFCVCHTDFSSEGGRQVGQAYRVLSSFYLN